MTDNTKKINECFTGSAENAKQDEQKWSQNTDSTCEDTNAKSEQGDMNHHVVCDPVTMELLLESIRSAIENPSPQSCSKEESENAENTATESSAPAHSKRDANHPEVLVADSPIGPLNLTLFENHQKIGEVSMNQLLGLGKRELCRAIVILCSWNDHRVQNLIDLEAKCAWALDKEAHAKQTTYGAKSERRKTMENAAGKSKDNAAESTQAVPEEKERIEESKEEGATSSNSQQESNAASVNGDAAQNSQTDSGKSEPQKKRPKRTAGCAAKVTNDLLHLTLKRQFTPEELEERFPDGNYTKLSSESYEYILFVQLPVRVIVEAERYRDDKTGKIICAAPAHEVKFLPKSTLTSQLLARLMFMRYSMGLSVTRILKDLETKGLRYTRQSIYRWSIQYALALMRPMVTRLLQKILESGKAQTDESWMKVREELAKENRHNSVVWLIRTSERLGIPPMVVLTFTGSRSADELAKIIKGFAGKLMADGYAGYGKLLNEYADTLILVGCLQHARSRFVDCIQAMMGKKEYQKLTEEQKAELPCNVVLDMFEKIFRAEKNMDSGWSFEKKKAYRDQVIRPLMTEMFKLIKSEQDNCGKHTLGYYADALNYAMKYKERFFLAVDDPEMPLHNSACERCFAAFGIHRSNFKQIDTILGAEACCMWFSVIQTARLNDVNEQTYLEYLIEKLPEALKMHGDYHWKPIKSLRDSDDWPTYGKLDYLDAFMPWSDDYKAYEKQSTERQKKTFIELAELLANQETGA